MNRSFHRTVPCAFPLLAAATFAACASSATQRAYVAPTQETIVTTTEETASSPGQIIYIQNLSSVPVSVYSVTLRDCENIKHGCNGPQSLKLRVRPGGRGTLIRVEPDNPEHAYTYRVSYGWRADSSTTAALTALASAGDDGAQAHLNAIASEETHRRNAVGAIDLDLTAADIAGMADRAGSLRVVPDSLVLAAGARVNIDTMHVLLLDAQGQRLGRIRGGVMWRTAVSPAVRMVLPDTLVAVAAGRTSMQLKISDDVLPGKPALHDMLVVPVIVR